MQKFSASKARTQLLFKRINPQASTPSNCSPWLYQVSILPVDFMLKFLHQLWDLARVYRARMLMGVATGILGGLIEPVMIATIALVYALVFPSSGMAAWRISPPR
jgi:hypothetical protein